MLYPFQFVFYLEDKFLVIKILLNGVVQDAENNQIGLRRSESDIIQLGLFPAICS